MKHWFERLACRIGWHDWIYPVLTDVTGRGIVRCRTCEATL